MSDLDSRLLNSILLGNRGEVIAEQGLTPEMFESDARPILLMVISHFRQHNKLPSKMEILRHFKNFHFKKATEPIEYYTGEINRRFKMVQFRNTISEALASIEKTEDAEIDKVLADVVGKFNTALMCGTTHAIDYINRIDEIETELFRKRAMPAEHSFGMAALDNDLIGTNGGDLTLLGGESGLGKTWVLLQMAYNDWYLKQQDSLIISLEMNPKIIQDRLDAIMCKFDYSRYRRGNITEAEEALLYSNLRAMKERETSLRLISFENYDSKAKAKLGSVDSVYACIQRYKPKRIWVDGLYLGMSMKWEEATAFANDFHSMLENCHVPCTATTQLKQEADANNPKLKDLAFTAAFQHASSYVFMMGYDKDHADRGVLTATTVKCRESEERKKYVLEFKPATKIEMVSMDLEPVRQDWWDDSSEALNGEEVA